jgi:hypothetical protein
VKFKGLAVSANCFWLRVRVASAWAGYGIALAIGPVWHLHEEGLPGVAVSPRLGDASERAIPTTVPKTPVTTARSLIIAFLYVRRYSRARLWLSTIK